MSDQLYSTLLTFQLNDEFFALDVMHVKHILEVSDITGVPDTPDYLKGVINLHGNVIPVIDLRMMMGFELKDFTEDSAIIVLAPDNHQDSSLGLIVDMVKEVIETEGIEMKPTVVDHEKGMLKNFQGTFSLHDQFVHVIDTDELVAAAEV
jgi:purine-binding chemotaxis protein CheW